MAASKGDTLNTIIKKFNINPEELLKANKGVKWDTVKNDIVGGTGRWNFATILGKEKRIFSNDFLEALNKFAGKSFNAEDVGFIEPAYKDALGQLKENGSRGKNLGLQG